MINMINYRVIDLSYELVPGERKVDGNYLHGHTLNDRPIEVQEFKAWNARMHHIQGQTHTGTHVECPYKYSDDGADFSAMPVTSFIGEAAACNFQYKKAGESVSVDDFRDLGVKTGDIVLVWGSEKIHDNQPYISNEAIDWLIKIKIKMLGWENIGHANPGTPYGPGDSDYKALTAGIMFVDGLHGLNQITKPRVFFMALPVKIRRVTASWTRAIVLEEI